VRVTRRSCLATAVLTVLLTAGPALADYDMDGKQEGGDPGPGLSALETLALYVLVPALILLVIGGLAYLQGGRRGDRYRPTRGWDATPMWFAGPPNPAQAVSSVGSDDAVLAGRGGASGSW
jgi:hypothetical protein